MKKLIAAIIIVALISCAKNDDITPLPPSGPDMSKFTDKEWYSGYRSNPPALSFIFKSDHSGVETLLTNWLPPYAYARYNYNWYLQGQDSIVVTNWSGQAGVSAKFKIFTLNDSVLITNNWTLLGLSDTIKNRFQTY